MRQKWIFRNNITKCGLSRQCFLNYKSNRHENIFRVRNLIDFPKIGLKLQGKYAKEFWENEKNPQVTDEQVEMFKEAKRIYREHPF